MATKKKAGERALTGGKTKPLDAAAVEAVIKNAAKTARRILDGEDDPAGEFDTGVACRIPDCKGTIIEDVSYKYFGDPMNAIIGPGYRNQLTRVVAYYCSSCAIPYHHLPERAKKRAPLPEK